MLSTFGSSARRRAARPAVSFVLVSVVLGCFIGCDPEPIDDPIGDQIERVTQDGRHWSGRLSVEHRHHPIRADGAPELALTTDQAVASTRAEATVHGLTRGAEPAEADHLRGLFELTVGKLDVAIEHLRAASLAPSGGPLADAAIHADLAVALLTRWNDRRRTGVERPLDWLDALDAIEQAVTLAPDDPVIRFDRALILDRGSLHHLARTAWQDYLDRSADDDPGWIREARQHLRQLDEPTVRERFLDAWNETLGSAEAGDPSGTETLVEDFPFFARLWIEEHLLPAWGAEPAATWRLDLAKRIAAALAAQRGDHLLADAVVAIDSASPASRASLAEAHRRYGEGMALYREQRLIVAEPEFVAARDALAAAGSPFVGWADFHLAILAYYDDAARGGAALQRLVDTIDPTRHPALAGRAHWVLGTAVGVQGDDPASIAHYRSALDLLSGSSGPVGSAFVHLLLAEAFDPLGEIALGWRHRREALAGLAGSGYDRRLHSTLLEASQALLRHERPREAELFANEMIAHARHCPDNPYYLAAALAQRAWIRSLADRHEDAQLDLAAARRQLTQVPPGDLPKRLGWWLELYEAFGRVEDEPAAAVEQIAAALDAFDRRGWRFERERYLTAQARGLRSLGRIGDAEAILDEAIGSLEAQRNAFEAPSLRLAAFRRAQPLFDQWIGMRLDAGRTVDALRVAERARARFILERQPVDISWLDAERRAAWPVEQVLVSYTVLGDRVSSWVVDRDTVRHLWLPESASMVRAKAERLRSTLQSSRSDPDSIRSGSAELFDSLITPLDLAPTVRRLILAPEDFLSGVPWSALWDTTHAAWLIERVEPVLVPAGRAMTLADGLPLDETPSLLAIGVDADMPAEDLPALHRAEADARAIAGLYDGTLLVGPIDPAQLIERFDAASVIHFAGHAVANADAPERSWFWLGGDTVAGQLMARDLWQADLAHVELVVLAACGSMVGHGAEREGLFGLAGGFLAAGARQVVATQWNILDGQSTSLMITFHREYAERRDATAALAAAIRSLLNNRPTHRTDPRVWAPFVVVGTIENLETSP